MQLLLAYVPRNPQALLMIITKTSTAAQVTHLYNLRLSNLRLVEMAKSLDQENYRTHRAFNIHAPAEFQ